MIFIVGEHDVLCTLRGEQDAGDACAGAELNATSIKVAVVGQHVVCKCKRGGPHIQPQQVVLLLGWVVVVIVEQGERFARGWLWSGATAYVQGNVLDSKGLIAAGNHGVVVIAARAWGSIHGKPHARGWAADCCVGIVRGIMVCAPCIFVALVLLWGSLMQRPPTAAAAPLLAHRVINTPCIVAPRRLLPEAATIAS